MLAQQSGRGAALRPEMLLPRKKIGLLVLRDLLAAGTSEAFYS